MRHPTFSIVDASSPSARWAMMQYFGELAARFPEGFDGASAVSEAAESLNPPLGLFILAGDVASPSGCGAVHFLDDERGEIKRMWVAPDCRGKALATLMLAHLEEEIRRSGRTTVVLDTNETLTNAIALYERCGYQPIPRYNDNPHAHFWFTKTLAPRDQP